MPEKLSERDSTALHFVRVIAILTSVAAHVSVIDTSTPTIGFFTRMWDMLSCISVPGFLIVGGILYVRTAGDSLAFWKRKAKSIILPWLFCGLLTYGYRSLYEGGSIMGLVYWVIGHGSWLYYVTMYLILLAFFKFIHKSVPLLWACVAITAVQFILKANRNSFITANVIEKADMGTVNGWSDYNAYADKVPAGEKNSFAAKAELGKN